MSDRDHYDILGLKSNADGAMVNQAYWQLARKYQTMAVSDPRARQMLDDLNEAYAVLGTPHRREEYDEHHRESFKAHGIVKRRRARARARAAPARVLETPDARAGHAGREALASTPADTPVPPLAVTVRRALAIAAIAMAAAIGLASVLGLAGPMVLAGGTVLLVAGGAAAIAAGLRLAPRAAAQGDVAEPLQAHVAGPALSSMRRTQERNTGSAAAAFPGRPVSATDLLASTAAMRGRWRDAVGSKLAVGDDGPPAAPDRTLVDIFESEREVETDGEPLNAVMDILRGSRSTVELH